MNLPIKLCQLAQSIFILSLLIAGCAQQPKNKHYQVHIVEANIADQEQLYEIPGIGPSRAAEILKERKNHQFSGCPDFVTRVGITKTPSNFGIALMSERGLRVNGEICR